MTSYRRKISLRAENAGCDRGGTPIVRGLTASVEPGEAVQLFGANGAGKTSLLNLFAGHLKPAEGNVAWRTDDGEWAPAPPPASIVFVGHETSMKPALTAEENLVFWARTYGLSHAHAETAAYGALDRVAMTEHAKARAGRLSAGQRRRLDIARAVMANREVWLMDEPAAAIDEAGAKIVCDVIAEHQKKGGVAFIATHDRLEVASRKLVIG